VPNEFEVRFIYEVFRVIFIRNRLELIVFEKHYNLNIDKMKRKEYE